jgi:hypothetical protein
VVSNFWTILLPSSLLLVLFPLVSVEARNGTCLGQIMRKTTGLQLNFFIKLHFV